MIGDTLQIPGSISQRVGIDNPDMVLAAPVIRPQYDRGATDETPSPLLLPSRRAITTGTLQPLRQLHVNQQHIKSTLQPTGINLSGLNDKLGFHVPARETITPRGSDDEGEDSSTMRRMRKDGKKMSNSRTRRNARSLCIEERARGRSYRQVAPRKALSALPAALPPANSGTASPSERRGRSRDIKPCSRFPESNARLPGPIVIKEDNASGGSDTAAEGEDVGAIETATVEDMLALKETPRRPANRQKLRSYNGLVHRSSNSRLSGTKSLRLTTCSPVQSRQLHRSAQVVQARSRVLSSPCSIDNLVSELVTEPRPSLPSTKSPKCIDSKKNRDISAKSQATLVPPKPVRALSQKSCPTIVKHIANIFAPASPVSSQSELPTEVDGPNSTDVHIPKLPRRTASISLKRIQDQDLENIMGSSIVRIPSPITSPRAVDSDQSSKVTSDSDSDEQGADSGLETPSVPVQRHGPFHWLRHAVPLRKNPLLEARALFQTRQPSSPRPWRSVSYQVLSRGAPGQSSDDSLSRGFLKRSRTSSSATEGGDQKRHYTRWDGVKTPITKEDHPVHWAVLQRKHQQDLRKQASKQSLKHGLISPTSGSPGSNMLSPQPIGLHVHLPYAELDPLHLEAPLRPPRVVSATSLNCNTVNTPSRPMSYRHESSPALTTRHSTTTTPGDFLRLSLSHESLPTASQASLAGSFDSKVAYKACKGEAGYVNFDKVLGLHNHATHQGGVLPQD
ncbi:hypothetical protein QFC19_001950 [Naganishia cerealis]|uniref:Uncharacterized protein n=1 Tax=Naganishia cerealis TaxID=610337 RepID=A0ACC2WD86_9TREE|nr:hypothetical protein QFC19_001950 [Naganishia cerealis]